MLMGNITRTPELKFTPQGTAVLELGLAINRKWKDDHGNTHEEVTFIDVTFWRKAAETLAKWVSKGDPLYVEGSIRQDSWEKDGKTQRKTRITGEAFQFLRSSGKGGKHEEAPPEGTAPPASGKPGDDEEEVPF
jgi:single-strand DNA-binding protein